MTSARDLLIEIGCEELPPHSLYQLAQAFGENVKKQLAKNELNFGEIRFFATPRRLAVWIQSLDVQQADREIVKRGPSYQAGYDSDGQPTKATLGFAKSSGIPVDQLEIETNEKGKWVIARQQQTGHETKLLLPLTIKQSIATLSIERMMRWGSAKTEFVRPVHWAMILFGNEMIACNLLGKQSTGSSYGHRFHANKAIEIDHPRNYESLLEKAFVVVDFNRRKQLIMQQLQKIAQQKKAQLMVDEALLAEVTALVEWPVAYLGSFPRDFLRVPSEVLIASMQTHQKSFPLFDSEGRLLHYFMTVANIDSQDPASVIQGNERVMRARLADAAFFYETDCKRTLASHIESMADVVFQAELGSLYDKAQRLARLAPYIAKEIGCDEDQAVRSGLLAKCDLMTDMVAEFPELQGVIGYYYALNDKEPKAVAHALKEQYYPRFAGDSLPETPCGNVLALTDNLDHLIGIFAMGYQPSGDKDPFKLRRAALSVIRIIIEQQYKLDLMDLLSKAYSNYSVKLKNEQAVQAVSAYLLERLRYYYASKGIGNDRISAVLVRQSNDLFDLHQRLLAIDDFCSLEASKSLAAAHKRVNNLLRKLDESQLPDKIKKTLLHKAAEKDLVAEIEQMQFRVKRLCDAADYQLALSELTKLKASVDYFFDEVMVMVEDQDVRYNRLRILADLRKLFLQIADISLLQL